MRKILLPMDPSDYTQTAFAYATEIARKNDALIEGIALIDVLDVLEQETTFLPLPQGVEGREEEDNRLLAEVREKVDKVLRGFETDCHEKHLRCTLKAVEGRPDFIIEKESSFSDLVIIGMRNFFHFETTDKPETSLKHVLGHSITPVFAVTKEYRPVKKVLMTYDGSMPSLRAIQRFALMMRGNDYEIVLLTKSNNEKEAHEEFEKVERYLKEQGSMHVTKRWTDQSLRKVFEQDYLNTVDLVVCGMHSQNFLKKFFVGSFTEYLIELNTVPIFIGQ